MNIEEYCKLYESCDFNKKNETVYNNDVIKNIENNINTRNK